MNRKVKGRCRASTRSVICLCCSVLMVLCFMYMATFDSKVPETESLILSSPTAHDDLDNGDNVVEMLQIHRHTLKKLASMHAHRAVAIVSCENQLHFDRACVDTKCPFPFPDPEQNIRQLIERKFQVPAIYKRVMANMVSRDQNSVSVAFVTAISANHYEEFEALVRNMLDVISPVISKLRLIVYDLGLNQHQRDAISKYCQICVLKMFPFQDLPPVFMNLKSYTWKPVIIQAHLLSSATVIWMDSSVRFLTGDLSAVLNRVKTTGVLVSPSHVSTALHTSLKMFSYFGHHACQFSQFAQLEGTFLIFHKDTFVLKVVIEPWVACAFSPECMFPFGSGKGNYSCRMTKRTYGYCHRFDQSALSMILAKVYGDKLDYIILRHGEINVNKRGNKVSLFPAQ